MHDNGPLGDFAAVRFYRRSLLLSFFHTIHHHHRHHIFNFIVSGVIQMIAFIIELITFPHHRFGHVIKKPKELIATQARSHVLRLNGTR